MFIGHYAVALAGKRIAPQTSLGALLAAALFIDLLWPIFLVLGWEKVRIDPGNTAFTPLDFVSYPISHSLVTTVGWGVLFAAVYWGRTRYTTGAITLGLLVISHWILDALVHRPDLPLYPGSAVLVGWGIWNSIPATLAIEGVMFFAGVWLYFSATEAKDTWGKYLLWGFLIFVILMYLGAFLGPPPPSTQVLAWMGLGVWLFPLWAWWCDRHRRPIIA